MRTTEFDRTLLRTAQQPASIDSYRKDVFGMTMFTHPQSSVFAQTVITIDRDGSNLTRKFQLSHCKFKNARSAQAHESLYVFAGGRPVKVTKTSSFLQSNGPLT